MATDVKRQQTLGKSRSSLLSGTMRNNRGERMKSEASNVHHTATDGYTLTADNYVRGRPYETTDFYIGTAVE